MNLDSDVRSMQPGDYRKLTNGSPIAPSSSAYENAVQDVVCDVVGNQIVSNTLPSGTKKVVGVLEDRANNRAFYAVANSTAANNAIYKFENGTISLVMQSAILDFALTDFVDMDIVGDILIFTNGRSEIKKINIVKAAAGDYTLATEITLIKRPPQIPMTFSEEYDNNVLTNYVAGNYFQFFQRYIYEDNDYSVFGPCSKVSNGYKNPSGTAVVAVAPNGTVLSGLPGTIDGASVVAGNRVLVQNTGIYIVDAGAWPRSVDFASGAVNINVPVIDGNNYGGTIWNIKSTNVGVDAVVSTLTKGPNSIVVTVPESVPSTVIGIDYAVRVNGSNELIVYRQEKKGGFGASHTFYNDKYLFTVPDTDSFVWNDFVPLKSKSLKIFKNRVFVFNNTEGYDHKDSVTFIGEYFPKVVLTLVEFAPPYLTGSKYFKQGGRYNIGLVFFDTNRRNSGVKAISEISIPDDSLFKRYRVTVDNLWYFVVPSFVPTWATHFSIVVTKNLITEYFISGWTQDIYFSKQSATGTYSYSKTLSGFSADATAIDISSLSKQQQGYTFSKGDKIRLKNFAGLANYFTIEAEIIKQEGRFVFTRVLSELSINASVVTNMYFEIYSPKKVAEEPFYEIGATYPIAQIATPVDIEGDVSVWFSNSYADNTGYNTTDPFANDYTVISRLVVESGNIWNGTKWVDQTGRSLIKSDSRQISKYTSIRFGQQYIVNSNVFGLNTFYALDEYAMPIENGIGTRLAPAGKVLVAIHQIETTALYIGEGFVNTTNQNNFLAKTDSVIGDDQKYLGGYGTLHPESVVAREGRVYYLDMRKGVVVRRSQDGLTPISEYGVKGLISTLCNVHAALGVNSQIRAGWDPQYDCYCLSFVNTSNDTGYTLYWHERSNGWVFITDMRPEMWGLLGQRQLSFRNGELWQQALEGSYNSFFGVQYDRTLEMEFSPLRSLIHIWDAIEVDVENIYTTAGTNEDVVLLYQKNGGTVETKINYLDFRKRESDRVWRSSFFRWINDVNYGSPVESKYKSSHRVRGQSAFLVLKYKGTDRNPMKSVTIFYTPSMQSTP